MAVQASPPGPRLSCPACGTPAPQGAAFCSRCGRALGEPRPRTGRLAYEACTVERWRGYVTSRFYAATDDGVVVVESRPFRWRKAESPPNEGPAREAYDELVHALERQGWRRNSVGDLWWASRFTRGVAVPIHEPSYAYPEPVMIPEPEPEPLVETPVEPAAPVEAAKPRRRLVPKRRRLALAALWLVTVPAAAALILTTVPHGGGAKPASAGTGSVAHMVVPKRRTPVPAPDTAKPKQVVKAARQTKAAPVVEPAARLVLTGSDRSTWLEVRRGSATGKVLFSGELAAGQRLAFTGPRLWGRFGAAANVRITFDGRRVPLQGTVEHLFAPAK